MCSQQVDERQDSELTTGPPLATMSCSFSLERSSKERSLTLTLIRKLRLNMPINENILYPIRYMAFGVFPAILWIESAVAGSILATYFIGSLGPAPKNIVRGIIATWVIFS